MKEVPESDCNSELSRSSRNCCTCGASSEPYVAVAIRQPPPDDENEEPLILLKIN